MKFNELPQQNDSNETEAEEHTTSLKVQKAAFSTTVPVHEPSRSPPDRPLEARQAQEASGRSSYGGIFTMSRGASSELSPGTPNSSSSGSGNGLPALKVAQRPPSHAFVDEWFDVKIHLDALPGYFGQYGASDAVELRADLHGCDASGSPFPEAVPSGGGGARVVIDSPGFIRIPLVRSSGKSRKAAATVRCRIDAAVRSDRLTQFCLRFAPKDDQDEALRAVRPVFTSPIVMVAAKLKIQAEGWESVWYKDEGGRDKCMTAQVVLCDADGSPIPKRRVPLKLTLLYDNDQSLRVMKQEILRVLGSPKHSIDPDTASATVQFRIEDVSKNHQGMDFRVEVSPDVSRYPDIAPVCTPAVSVRSKRNKRQRTGSSGATPRQAASSMTQQQMGGPMGSGMPPPRSPMQSYSTGGDQPLAGLTGVADIARLRQAMKGVIQWTEEVVNGLYPLKWQVIGYAQFPDGTVDYNRPYHSMPNPNACISKVLSLYSDETREHLRVLLTAVENTRSSSAEVEPAQYGGPEEGFRALGPQTPSQQGPAAHQPQGQMANSSMAPLPYGAGAPPAPGMYHPTMAGQSMGSSGMYMKQGTPHAARAGGPPPMQQQWQVPQYGYSPPGPPLHMGAASQGPMQPLHSGLGGEGGGQMAHLDAMQEGRPDEDVEAEPGQEDIEHILAKQYKSLSTGDRLGFPCYNAEKEIMGFIRESSMKVGVGQFIPISKHGDEFGPMEMAQASRILEEAMASDSQALHSKEDWGTVASLIDHALVYEWSKEIPGASNASDSNRNH